MNPIHPIHPIPPRPGFSEAFHAFDAALLAGLPRMDPPAALEVGLKPEDIEARYSMGVGTWGAFPDLSENPRIVPAHADLLRSLDPLLPIPVVFDRRILKTPAPDFQKLSARL